jgi:hypothetical protein
MMRRTSLFAIIFDLKEFLHGMMATHECSHCLEQTSNMLASPDPPLVSPTSQCAAGGDGHHNWCRIVNTAGIRKDEPKIHLMIN